MMSNNKLDIKLNKSFENYEAQVSQEVKLKLSKKIARFNFLKFNLTSFNIFYLTLVIIGIILILSVSFVTKSKSNKENQIKEDINLLIKEEKIKSLDTLKINNNSKSIIADTIKNKRKLKNNADTLQTFSKQPIKSANKTQVIVEPDSQIINLDTINKNPPVIIDENRPVSSNLDTVEPVLMPEYG
ncbi:MAG: hypothetical protein PHW82_14895 [Bacteroidales bacterium]|nr:hypothetical protein [Bacteroidales bacterium]